MTRLASACGSQLTLQVRQRFLHATVFSEVTWLAVLLPRQMPRVRHPSSNLHRSTSKPPLIPRRLKSVPNRKEGTSTMSNVPAFTNNYGPLRRPERRLCAGRAAVAKRPLITGRGQRAAQVPHDGPGVQLVVLGALAAPGRPPEQFGPF